MTPQLEAVAIAALGAVAICALALAWAAIATGRDRRTWTVAANNLAARLTDTENHLNRVEQRVATLERARTTPGPRLGVVPDSITVSGSVPPEAFSEALRGSRGKQGR